MSWHHDRLWGPHPAVTTGKDRSLGQRAADRMKATLATWTALLAILLVIAAWLRTNGFGHDPSPWIKLNLCLSCFAALQCFVLLIANKRGEQIAAEVSQHTLELAIAMNALLETNTDLTRDTHKNTEAIEEVHEHLTVLCRHFKLDGGRRAPDSK
jgi:uncharacterized membrane protein